MVQMRLRSGKADFVKRQLADGKTEDICLCKYNADFSITGCFTQVPNELVHEVMTHNGQYTNETRKALRASLKGKLPDLRCEYCYARRMNWGKVTPMTIGNKTLADFEEFKPEIIRLGKMTEAGHQYYNPLLIQFLDICKKFNTQVIFPTKMLSFDERIAQRLIDTNSVLSYSIGYDKLERGACSQGCSNEWRINEAHKYLESGVNTVLTIVCDATSSIEENVSRGSSILEALNAPFPIPRRLLPIRPHSNSLALAVTGRTMSQLTYLPGKETRERGYQPILGLEDCMIDSDEEKARILNSPYIRKANGELIPFILHSDFEQFRISKDICGRVGPTEFCDMCHLCANKEKIAFPASELVKVTYDIDRKKDWTQYRSYRSRKARRLRQPELPFEV